jgi:hypothetical protein
VKKNKTKQRSPVAKPPAPLNTKVPPPRNLTPPLCEKLRRDMMQACLKVAETHGLTVEGGELSDIDLRHGFDISFRVGIPMPDGAIYSLEKEMFKVFAPQFGLDPSDYGRTFRMRGELYKIVEINPNRPKYSIGAERVADGCGFKMPAEEVVMCLQNSGT